jgi:hypothetical protein
MKQVLAVLSLAAVAAACGDGTGPSGDQGFSLSFATRPASGAAFSSTGMLDDTIIEGGNELIITSAQIVLREIELKREDDDGCESMGEGDDDGCEELEIGPMLVDLPLNGGAETSITIPVDTGTFDEIDFEVHKPEDGGSEDGAFLAAHPQFDGVSIRVEGTYNGVLFVYTSDLDVEQENQLNPPLVISAGTTSTNVTLLVDISTWFRNGSGALVNPESANKGGANESVVKENVKTSFQAFEDEDKDGDDSDES